MSYIMVSCLVPPDVHNREVVGDPRPPLHRLGLVTYFDRCGFAGLVGTREIALVVLNLGLFENYTGLPPWQVMLVRSFWKGGRWHDGWFCQVENEPVNVTPLAGKNGE